MQIILTLVLVLATSILGALPGVARAAPGEGPGWLSADSAIVVDQITGQVVFAKNAATPASIASITKLMTAMVILDANLPMEEPMTISQADVDTHKWSSSRLEVGTVISRAQALVLALMSSENRAAAALARTYPQGRAAFLRDMNRKARALGMNQTRFVDPTGLFAGNRATAQDLVTLVRAAYRYSFIRHVTTSVSYDLPLGSDRLPFRNTNRLVRNDESWEIGLSKTGFIREAGHCLVMQANVAYRPFIIVLLGAQGNKGRFGDADRVRDWLLASGVDTLASAAPRH